MKNIRSFFTLLIICAALISQVSCSKEKVIIPDTKNIATILTRDFESKDDLVIDEILDEVLLDLEEYDFLKAESSCPLISMERPEDSRYPRVITKDYGDGCVSDNGIERSGKIIVTVYGPWLKDGAKRTVNFEEYTHRGIAISGEKDIVNKGLNEDSLYVYAIKGKLTLVKEDTVVIEREFYKQQILLTGRSNSDGPKEWLVDGWNKVKRSNGISYKVNITTPLHKIQGCKWYQSGMKTVHFLAKENSKLNQDHKVYIDYAYSESDDGCDSYILRWVDDGESEVRNLNH